MVKIGWLQVERTEDVYTNICLGLVKRTIKDDNHPFSESDSTCCLFNEAIFTNTIPNTDPGIAGLPYGACLDRVCGAGELHTVGSVTL